MYRLSDSDSVDSDKGIRYKTDSIRNKDKYSDTDSLSNKRYSSSSQRERNRSRSRSPRHHDSTRKKVKRRKREHSSEDGDKRRNSSRSRDRKSNDRRANESMRKHRGKEEKKKEFPDGKSTTTLYGPVLPSRVSEPSKNRSSERKNTPELPSPVNIEKRSTLEEKQVMGSALLPSNELENIVVGPALPPDFKQKSSDDSYGPTLPPSDELENTANGPSLPSAQNTLTQNLSEVDSYGPTLPPSIEPENIGPAPLPDFTQKPSESDLCAPILPASTESEDILIGPALPSDLIQETSEDDPDVPPRPLTPEESLDKTIGPTLPSHLRQKLLEESSTFPGEASEEVASEDEVYGPVPEGENYSRAHVELEERALKMKMDQLEPPDEKPSREEWMTALPEARAKFGLGPRQFRSKAGPDLSDRSSWTDTPEDKAKKKAGKVEPKIDLQKEAELMVIRKRDQEQEAIVKKSRKHKGSLLETHQKKIKEKKVIK